MLLGELTLDSARSLYAAHGRVSVHWALAHVLRCHVSLSSRRPCRSSCCIQVLPRLGRDAHGAPTVTHHLHSTCSLLSEGKDPCFSLHHQTLMLVPSLFLMSLQQRNLSQRPGPHPCGVALACFFGSLLWVLLWVILLSSVAAPFPQVPAGPLRREPEWSRQNYQGSGVLRGDDCSFQPCTLKARDPAFLLVLDGV